MRAQRLPGLVAEVPRAVLPLTVAALTTGAAVFFAGSAVAPALSLQWNLSPSEGAALSWSVQLGFLVGTLVSVGLNLPDRFPPARLIAGLLALAAASNAMLVVADSVPLAIASRVLTGALAGPVYPIGMKLLATWFPRLGWQMGLLLAFNTLGFGGAFFLRALRLPIDATLIAASGFALAGAIVAGLGLREGALLPARSRFDPRAAVDAFRVPEYRRSALGYFGHMWELFAFWALLPFWLLASGLSPAMAAMLAGGVFVSGALGCLAVGAWSLRVGESRAAFAMLAASGAACLASPWLFDAPLPVLAPVVLLWGAAVISDSAMYSAISARSAPRAYVGTALTAQNTIGFGITIVSIALVPLVVEAAGSWRWGLLVLAPGPLLGLIPLSRLAR